MHPLVACFHLSTHQILSEQLLDTNVWWVGKVCSCMSSEILVEIRKYPNTDSTKY